MVALLPINIIGSFGEKYLKFFKSFILISLQKNRKVLNSKILVLLVPNVSLVQLSDHFG
jgi:hypothetical protein